MLNTVILLEPRSASLISASKIMVPTSVIKIKQILKHRTAFVSLLKNEKKKRFISPAEFHATCAQENETNKGKKIILEIECRFSSAAFR